MDETTQIQVNNIRLKDKELKNAAFTYLMATTEEPVAWAYEVWDEIVAGLRDKDNRIRAISAQVLCNLAKSDSEKRMLADFPALLAVTKDERFVTARHCLQSLWKVGAAGKELQSVLMDGLASRFNECINEKNCTLIRYDIIQGFKNLYDEVQDDTVRERALALIATEEDSKYLKKYAKVWK